MYEQVWTTLHPGWWDVDGDCQPPLKDRNPNKILEDNIVPRIMWIRERAFALFFSVTTDDIKLFPAAFVLHIIAKEMKGLKGTIETVYLWKIWFGKMKTQTGKYC